jgi:2-polyprenyl-6-methoxyphenol hydroxylase-like FAD-dependent oxidoreductase
MSRCNVVVIGGSAAGLATALLLSQDGHAVRLLEEERLPECATPLEAFELWERRGSPQSRHSHAFLARLHNAIKNRVPRLYQDLMEAGADTLRFSDMAREVFGEAELIPEDEEITLLACRRITYDWVMRRYVERETDAVYESGVQVRGLLADRDPSTDLPRVRGVRVQRDDGSEEEIEADLVVDASGRNSSLREWLEEIGTEPFTQESESCGIFYCSRFYRLLDDAPTPAIDGPIGADLGYMKYAIFLGDSRIFSITLAAAPSDDALREVRRSEVFQAAATALPSTRAWVDPAVSAPITDVYTYANLKNTLRFFVRDGRPLALGLYPVGDSLVHMNPISGRGCTAAWIGAELLTSALRTHPGDPLAFALELDAGVQRELVPWYQSMREQDRGARETSQLTSEGIDPFAFQRPDGTIDPKGYMRSILRDGLMPAMREDIVVLRAFMRVFNMLDTPSDLLTKPELMQRVLAVWQRREQREPMQLGPPRAEMLRHLENAA